LMQTRLSATPAIATLVALPVAGFAAWQLLGETWFGFERQDAPEQQPIVETEVPKARQEQAQLNEQESERSPMPLGRLAYAPEPNAMPPADAMAPSTAAPFMAPSGSAAVGDARQTRGLSDGFSRLVPPPA